MPVVNKKHPSLLLIMYHVFIGSLIKLAFRIVKSVITFFWRLTKKISIKLAKCVRAVLLAPVWFTKFIHSKFVTKTVSIVENTEKTVAREIKFITPTLRFIWQCICQTGWYIKHQLALTSLHEIRAMGEKPISSLGWELWSEFNPRHKLDFWMGDSHVTVEIRHVKYDHKRNRLQYVEHGSRKPAHVHSPHGVPHMVCKVHWWEPVVEQTIKPYTPLHAISQTEN